MSEQHGFNRPTDPRDLPTPASTPPPPVKPPPAELPVHVDDGWTVREKINPEQGVHPGLTFHRRPVSFIEARRWERELEKLKDNPDARDLKRAELVATKVCSWSSPRPVNAENLLSLNPLLFLRLERIVNGWDRADQTEVELKN